MRHGRRLAILFFLVLAAPAMAAGENQRYELANGCYTLTSAGKPIGPGPFFMKPTALGSYMLYTKDKKFLAKTGAATVGTVSTPGPDADWLVEGGSGDYRLSVGGSKLTATGPVLTFGKGSTFDLLARLDGCATFPESGTGVTGAPSKAASPWGWVKGFLDAHMHWMAYEFLGGKAHCGAPWNRYGITVALTDCPDHSVPGSPGNVLETALGGKPSHDTVGWPTFGYWPNYFSETHESTYYKWVERAWQAGLRLFVSLYVDNAALCKVYPLTPPDRKNCNEMDTVRLEMKRLHELQDYVDAQSGGPGKGWFPLVTPPFEARRGIAEGKLAIIQGIEVSELFDCTETNGVNNCDRAKVDKNLDEVYKAGVRGMELVNKFDNAFVGVAGDTGTQGVIVNNGNKLETGHYWDMKTCQGLPADVHDREQYSGSTADPAFGPLTTFINQYFPGGVIPAYPPPPHCNTRGLTTIGQYLVKRMMDKGMIIDPDHMSVAARNSTLDLIQARKYSGVVSSHSWSTPDAYPRIYKLGGVITPIGGDSTDAVKDWKTLKPLRDKRYYFGFGWGADLNGFHSSGSPRADAAKNPVTYPFKSYDGKQTIDKLTTGERTWDINKDGVAHYGLYPDWIEDIRKIGGNKIVADYARGSEAYLEMWERATGVPAYRPVPSRSIFTTKGLFRVKLGVSNEALLRSVGQPEYRGPFVWRWGIQKRPIKNGKVWAVIGADGRATLIASTGLEHQAAGVNVGDDADAIGGSPHVGRGLELVTQGSTRGYVFGVKDDKVIFTGVTSLRGKPLRAAVARLHLL